MDAKAFIAMALAVGGVGGLLGPAAARPPRIRPVPNRLRRPVLRGGSQQLDPEQLGRTFHGERVGGDQM